MQYTTADRMQRSAARRVSSSVVRRHKIEARQSLLLRLQLSHCIDATQRVMMKRYCLVYVVCRLLFTSAVSLWQDATTPSTRGMTCSIATVLILSLFNALNTAALRSASSSIGADFVKTSMGAPLPFPSLPFLLPPLLPSLRPILLPPFLLFTAIFLATAKGSEGKLKLLAYCTFH